MRVAIVVVRALAHCPVVTGIALGVDATCTLHAYTHALGCSTPVVIGALIIRDALRLASIDCVAVRDEIVETSAEGDTILADFAAGVGAARAGSAHVRTSKRLSETPSCYAPLRETSFR